MKNTLKALLVVILCVFAWNNSQAQLKTPNVGLMLGMHAPSYDYLNDNVAKKTNLGAGFLWGINAEVDVYDITEIIRPRVRLGYSGSASSGESEKGDVKVSLGMFNIAALTDVYKHELWQAQSFIMELVPYLGLGTSLTSVSVETPSMGTGKGSATLFDIILGVDVRNVGMANLNAGLEFDYSIGKYVQATREATTVTKTDISLSGVKFGLRVSYLLPAVNLFN